MTSITDTIPLTSLVINIENPRFDMTGNQHDAIIVMLEDQKKKLVNLARDIVENGLNPADLPIVTSHETRANQFDVLEGNRRITALKLLNNPGLIPEKHKTILNHFRKIAKQYNKQPITELQCVIFDKEKDAIKWIKLSHTGENEGVGTVTWDAQQKARFEEQFGGKSNYALQIIKFLKNDDSFDVELKKKLSAVPLSSLQRLLQDPDIRDLIGIEIDDRKVISCLPADEIKKPLKRIIMDLVRDNFTISDIYHKKDRMNYIETFRRTELPDRKLAVDYWEVITPIISTKRGQTTKRSKPFLTTRNRIIPKSCVIPIDPPRINKIYRELKDLDLRCFINAGAITLRVFITLSVDTYIEKKKLQKVKENAKLSNKVRVVANQLVSNRHLTKSQIKPLTTSITNLDSILSITASNAYVHNKHFNPIENDLKTIWDNIEPFIVKLWDVI